MVWRDVRGVEKAAPIAQHLHARCGLTPDDRSARAAAKRIGSDAGKVDQRFPQGRLTTLGQVLTAQNGDV